MSNWETQNSVPVGREGEKKKAKIIVALTKGNITVKNTSTGFKIRCGGVTVRGGSKNNNSGE